MGVATVTPCLFLSIVLLAGLAAAHAIDAARREALLVDLRALVARPPRLVTLERLLPTRHLAVSSRPVARHPARPPRLVFFRIRVRGAQSLQKKPALCHLQD
jgi:hypothetical protein